MDEPRPPLPPPIEDVIAYIHGDPAAGMIAGVRSEHVAIMRAQWELWQPDNLLPGKYGLDIGRALRRFAILTWPETHRDVIKRYILDLSDEELAYASLWDHKAEIRRRFGRSCHDAAADRSYRFDVWSNLCFGFVGTAAGFPDRLLRSGAGAAQLIAGTIPPGYVERLAERLGDLELFPALDDPCDQEAIRLGATLWKREGEALTQEALLAAVRAARGLATRAGRVTGDGEPW